jgi:hypothetical protein
MLCIGYRVTNDLRKSEECKQWNERTAYIFKENLEDPTGLFIDKTRDSFDTTTTSKPTNGGLGDSWRSTSTM